MRLYCEFLGCPCSQHVGGRDSRCSNCGHGSCWHKRANTQFNSSRSTARRPLYMMVIIPTLPEVPPLPGDSFQNCVEALPV